MLSSPLLFFTFIHVFQTGALLKHACLFCPAHTFLTTIFLSSASMPLGLSFRLFVWRASCLFGVYLNSFGFPFYIVPAFLVAGVTLIRVPSLQAGDISTAILPTLLLSLAFRQWGQSSWEFWEVVVDRLGDVGLRRKFRLSRTSKMGGRAPFWFDHPRR